MLFWGVEVESKETPPLNQILFQTRSQCIQVMIQQFSVTRVLFLALTLFYGDFLMRSSRERKKNIYLAWMKVDGWVIPMNDFFIHLFIFIVTQYPCHPLLRHQDAIPLWTFLELRTHPKQRKKLESKKLTTGSFFKAIFWVKYFLR